MKRLLLIATFFAYSLYSYCQLEMPMKDGKVVYEEIDSMTISKADLYNRSRIWFVNTFKSAKAVIQLEDKEAGIIMGKGVTSFEAGNLMAGPLPSYINYTININVKDNKYRLQVFDIYVSNERGSYTPEYCLKYPKMNKKKLERIDDNIKNLFVSYKAAINKKSDNF